MRTLAETLRGALKARSVDARRIMQAAKNPGCTLARAALFAGIDMDAMVRGALGAALDNSRQSPFALRQGTAFERQLSENGAARLVDALMKKGLLGPSETRVRHLGDAKELRSHDPRIREAAIRRAIAETEREIQRKAEGDPTAPNVLLQAYLPTQLAEDGVVVVLRADALIARDGMRAYRIGEMKSFPVLHHNTDPRDVAAAAAQAGVYAVALEACMHRMGLAHPVPTDAILILRRVGSFSAEPVMQTIERDIDVARRMLEQRPRTLAEVAAILGPAQALDNRANILKLPRNFTGACRSFCPMAKVCQQLAVANGEPGSVSNRLAEVVGGMRTDRALALLRGGTAETRAEAEVQQRLRRTVDALQKAS